jgi:hypothetical protein
MGMTMSTATHTTTPSGEPRHALPPGLPDLTVKRARGGLVASERDLQVAQLAQEHRLARTTPELGDYVRFPGNHYRRLSVSYGDGEAWQCEVRERTCGFYLHADGTSHCSVGSMSAFTLPGSSLTPSHDLRPADVWMFSNGRVEAHHGTYLTITVRVWDHPTVPDRLDRTSHAHS